MQQPLLEFRDIVRTLNQGEYSIRVSGALAANQIMVLEGPSGSGKTTLLRILARLLLPDSGSLFYLGKPGEQIAPIEWRRLVKYVPQQPVVFPGTMEENLKIPFGLDSVARQLKYDGLQARMYMQELGLEENLLEQMAARLSGGEAARMSLIRSLLIKPRILLLDEPTAYLDAGSRSRVLDLLKRWLEEEAGRGLIMVSHNKEDLNYLPQVSVITIEGKKAGLVI